MMHTRTIILITLLLGIMSFASAQDDENTVTITIINTADEHGWLQPFQAFGSSQIEGGAANIYRWWVEFEDYDPETTLLLSGGDNWTGPSISTWFDGAPMVAAMNYMQYDASTIGNHEFDFGRVAMERRFAEANFPYLSANTRYAESGEQVDFAQPYTLIEVNGVQVGVIGLTTTDTATSTHPKNIGDLIFIDYADALQEYVPQMREEGAQIIVGMTHICTRELAGIANEVPDLVDVLLAGHCNEATSRTVEGVSIIGSGDAWRSYAKLILEVDVETGEIVSSEADIVDVQYGEDEENPVTPDEELLTLVDEWQAEVDAQLSQVIGYTEDGLTRGTPAQVNWVTDSWLWAYPTAEIAMTNYGGFRADINPGAITWGDIVTVLPFDNVIMVVELTGEQIIENLLCCSAPAVSGMSFSVSGSDVTITLADGSDFDPEATYTVLVNDFMYHGGDGYLFSEQNPDGYDTAIHWRQPVIDYTASLETSEDSPLDDYLDATPRG